METGDWMHPARHGAQERGLEDSFLLTLPGGDPHKSHLLNCCNNRPNSMATTQDSSDTPRNGA